MLRLYQRQQERGHGTEASQIAAYTLDVPPEGGTLVLLMSGDVEHLVSNGQACYWFSNGCTPGCPSCDGTSSHVGHGGQSFRYRGMTRDEVLKANITVPWEPAPGDLVLDRSAAGTQALNITANCPRPASRPSYRSTKLN